jgi:hypothetical protein
MKTVWMTVWLVISAGSAHAQIPIIEIIKQGVVKVIKAVDLKIQRLQNETIWLQNAQKVMENTLSKLKLEEIAGWVEKQKELYASYYDELWQVRDAIAYYYRVRDIGLRQRDLIRLYAASIRVIRKDVHFSAAERDHMLRVYDHIMEASVASVEQLALVVKSFSLRMNDAARLALINSVAEVLDELYADLLQFNQQNQLLSLQRAKDAREIGEVRLLYGIQ